MTRPFRQCRACEWPRSCARDGCWIAEEEAGQVQPAAKPQKLSEPADTPARARLRWHNRHKRFIR